MMKNTYIDIVFDGPPSPEGPRFVEVENPNGESISVGEWIEREDGYNVLRLRKDHFPEPLIAEKSWPMSGNVEKTFYDGENIDILFSNGKRYRYIDAPPEIWQEMTESPSVGSFIARKIKGHYRYAKV